MSKTNLKHLAAAHELGGKAEEAVKDYTHQADRAATYAILALGHAVMALHNPTERLAGATEKISEWCENNWRLRD